MNIISTSLQEKFRMCVTFSDLDKNLRHCMALSFFCKTVAYCATGSLREARPLNHGVEPLWAHDRQFFKFLSDEFAVISIQLQEFSENVATTRILRILTLRRSTKVRKKLL